MFFVQQFIVTPVVKKIVNKFAVHKPFCFLICGSIHGCFQVQWKHVGMRELIFRWRSGSMVTVQGEE